MDVSRISPLYLNAAYVQEPWDTSSADSNQPKLAAKHSLGSTISEGGLRNGYISGLRVNRSCTLETCGSNVAASLPMLPYTQLRNLLA